MEAEVRGRRWGEGGGGLCLRLYRGSFALLKLLLKIPTAGTDTGHFPRHSLDASVLIAENVVDFGRRKWGLTRYIMRLYVI